MNRKADFILFIIILIAAGGIWLFLRYFLQAPGGFAVVNVNGEVRGRYEMDTEETISVPGADGGYNLLIISDGHASVTDADCPDKLCVKQKAISGQGESIICLPHRLVIRIEQGKEQVLDGITY